MNKRSLAGLILINAVLLAALVVTSFSPEPAQAQFGGGGGQYLMIAGDASGRSSQAAVYITDLRSGKIVAVMFNSSNNTLDFIASRDVGKDADRLESSR